MDDKELTSALRAEFESTIGKIFPSLNFIWIEDEQKYMPFDTHLCWTTWVEAKRSQPSVVLPTQYNDGVNINYDIEEVHAALTAAGIKYTVSK